MLKPVPAPPGARARVPSGQPDLSVIIPAVNGIQILLECLDALYANEAGDVSLDVVVIDRNGDETRRVLAERAPDVVVLPVPVRATIPEMRALGFRRARADAIAVIEDHVLVPPDWARQMLDALAGGRDVVGGSVQNAATGTTVDWAAFLCEYSHMLAPIGGERVEGLTGNNVVYRRALVERYGTVLDEGRWEDHFHSTMRADGIFLTCRPDITVGHKMHYRMRDYVAQRYLYARAYAGMKRSGLSLLHRVVFAIGSFALPPVLFARVVRRVLASNRHRTELVRSLPLLAVFVCAWAFGEAIGYAAGPGDALARVR